MENNHRKQKRVLSLLFAFVMVFGLFRSTQLAVNAADHSVNINGKTVLQIETDIQNTIDGALSNDTVTVTGSKTNVDTEIKLSIPAGITVIWKAAYTGDAEYMVVLFGAGVFEVAEGGTISTNNSGDGIVIMNYNVTEKVDIVVSGGTVSLDGDGTAIHNYMGDVMVTDGVVRVNSNKSGIAIFFMKGTTTVSGGRVEVTGSGYTWGITGQGNAVITGGVIEINGSKSSAVDVNDSVKITGGIVEAKGINSSAISAMQEGRVAITGGTVKAIGSGSYAIRIEGYSAAVYLPGTCIGDVLVQYKQGIIIEADSLAIPKSRDDTDEGLTTKDGINGAVAVNIAKWDCTGIRPVIQFSLEHGTTYNRTLSIEWGEYAVLSTATISPTTSPTGTPTDTGSSISATPSPTGTGSVTSSTPSPTGTVKAAAKPRIKKQPIGKKVKRKAKYILRIKATAAAIKKGSNKLLYQWYRNKKKRIKGGKKIAKATKTRYKVPTGKKGTLYYYCIVTNTDNQAAVKKTAKATSRVVKITVK